jgi:hypothetical protein
MHAKFSENHKAVSRRNNSSNAFCKNYHAFFSKFDLHSKSHISEEYNRIDVCLLDGA